MAKTYNTFGTVAPGDVLRANSGTAAYNGVMTNVNNYRVPPMVKCIRSGNLSYTANADVAWNDEAYDTDGMHDNATNNARITPTTAGVYVVTFSVHFTFSGTSSAFTLRMLKNGAEIVTRLYGVSRTTLHKDVISVIDTANGSTDFFTCQFEMGGASSLNVQASSGSYFAANWLGQAS
jgi:hypothetical protein